MRERVWFCPKGRKPPQRDTRDFDAGGNCIWYDEPALLAAVEKRLGRPIEELGPGLSLPDGMGAAATGVAYGEMVDDAAGGGGGGGGTAALAERVRALAGDVRELAAMEVEAQQIYLTLRSGATSAAQRPPAAVAPAAVAPPAVAPPAVAPPAVAPPAVAPPAVAPPAPPQPAAPAAESTAPSGGKKRQHRGHHGGRSRGRGRRGGRGGGGGGD